METAPNLERARAALAFPLDYPDYDTARAGLEQVAGEVGVAKVGLELFVREGPRAVEVGQRSGTRIFLDLKLHDIPQTVERAVASACQLGVHYLTLHALGSATMIEAAARRAARENTGLVLLAVTVLTSMDEADLRAVGIDRSPRAAVEQLAALALGAGAAGLVCSPLEVGALRGRFGPGPVMVTPGIRPSDAGGDDQKRTGTPSDAIRAGSSLLVVGRPIRDAKDPARAARAICEEIAAAQIGVG